MSDYTRENIKREMIFVLATELKMDIEIHPEDGIVIYTNLTEDKDKNLIPLKKEASSE